MELNTELVLEIFKKLSQIPRISKHEKKIGNWLLEWAKEHSFDAKQDSVGNIVISVPASKGYEKNEGYVLQGHMDMVGQATKDSTHDFMKDPIKPIVDGDWLRTNGETTLGADNGIGMAISMALAISEVSHPALELLFTVDEETGLTGALQLNEGFISHKKLINLDSEEIGNITIGCAGSQDQKLTRKYELDDAEEDSIAYVFEVTDGKGGHSGVDIHKKIVNANVVVMRFLAKLNRRVEFKVFSMKGGTVRNGIATSSMAQFHVKKGDQKLLGADFNDFKTLIMSEYQNAEPNLRIDLQELKYDGKALSVADTDSLVSALLLIPHGVQSMSEVAEGLVESSNNFAIMELDQGDLEVICMTRSSSVSKINEISDRINAVATLINGTYEAEHASPPWEPNPSSELAKKAADAYKKISGKDSIIESIHAGLECGVIAAPYPEMDMISIGPDITGAHTPDEKLFIPSVEPMIKWLVEILKK